MKLGKRLFISFLAVIFVVTLSIGIGAPFLIKEFLIESRKTELNDKGVDLIRFVRDFQEDRITYWQFGRLINNLDHFLGARIWILDDQDHLIFASEDASDNDEEDIPSPLGPPPLPWNSSAPFGIPLPLLRLNKQKIMIFPESLWKVLPAAMKSAPF